MGEFIYLFLLLHTLKYYEVFYKDQKRHKQKLSGGEEYTYIIFYNFKYILY